MVQGLLGHTLKDLGSHEPYLGYLSLQIACRQTCVKAQACNMQNGLSAKKR